MNPVHLALGAAIVVLAIIGLFRVLARVADGLERAWDWLSWRFRGDDGDDYTDGDERCGLCAGCIGFEHCDGRELGCECTCTWPEDWAEELEELPPERSREELGFTGPRLISPQTVELNHPSRERRAPWWEAEQRAAYESLGLDYPSGLLARVREAGQ